MPREQASNTAEKAQIEEYLEQIDEEDWYRIFRSSRVMRRIHKHTTAYAMAFALADDEIGPDTPSAAYTVIKKEAKRDREGIYQYGWPPAPGLIGFRSSYGADYL
jgi:hypothetical protein